MELKEFRPYGALYIHIPFCAKRCNYCDFETKAASIDDPIIDAYTESLIREIRESSRAGLLGSIKTIYIGGGTPTFIGHKRLVNLVYTLSLSLSLQPDTEFTIEANPESLSLPMVRDLYSLGVTRLSMGVQSFNDNELAALGRIHNSATALSAIETARERFENVSIDLMCGIPIQTPTSWQSTLQAAIKSGVTHVSVYPLTIEPNTSFGRSLEQGRMGEPNEDLQADMMEAAADILEPQSYERYEVASYAKPGYQCQHNIAYWTGVPYLGLGTGAAGMRENATGRERLKNGQVIEHLTSLQAAIEDLMLGMRMSRGVSAELVARVAQERPAILDTFSELEALGLTRFQDGRYIPTKKAWLLGNEVYGRIWASENFS
jgi:oxygen-independent coproporphyrinogen-3 oxidase